MIMNGQIKKYDNYLDRVPVFVANPNPYEIPKSLGFNLLKATKYAKKHNIRVSEIPEKVLKTL